jgi:hypothetical protein
MGICYEIKRARDFKKVLESMTDVLDAMTDVLDEMFYRDHLSRERVRATYTPFQKGYKHASAGKFDTNFHSTLTASRAKRYQDGYNTAVADIARRGNAFVKNFSKHNSESPKILPISH